MKKLFLGILAVTIFAHVANAFGNDWPGFRGPNTDGAVHSNGTLKFETGDGLKVSWQQKLGSGYSGISIADGKLVTMFSDSTYDFAIALDANNGQELWRFKIGVTYKGHDGSHDGPISTPLIVADKVFGLEPAGKLFALDFKSGKKIWEKNIIEAYGAKIPTYGFSTSPLMAEDILVLEVGKADGIIAGIDKDTGELLWSVGNDNVSYQSPIIIEVDGKKQLVCTGQKNVYGLAAATGEKIWEYNHDGNSGTNNPIRVGENKVFLKHKGGRGILLSIEKEADKFAVKEIWQSRGIKRTYTAPVYYDGHIYGYSSRFLTCVNADSGETVWKSRQPGDGFLIVVDGHLVISTKEGSVHLAKASPEGYSELASIKLFDNYTWTAPSFANGKIYVRSLGEIASIEVDRVTAVAEAVEEKKILSSKFAEFVKKVETSENKKELINAFMKEQKEFPIIESENLAHFIYRGEATDIAFAGDLLGYAADEPFSKIEGTDFFYYTAEVEPEAGLCYHFIKDMESNIVDSLNTRFVSNIFGPRSYFTMPKWQKPAHLEEPQGATGKIDTVRFESEIAENNRRVDIYLPAGYGESEVKYPVVYMHWGSLAQNFGLWKNSLDNVIGKTVEPIIVVFIPSIRGDRGSEYNGDKKDKYARMLAEELIPYVDKNYRTITSAEARANIAFGFSANAAFYTTFKNPGTFGKIAVQSYSIFEADEKDLYPIFGTASEQPLQIYMDWAKYEFRSTVEGWDLGVNIRKFAKFLERKGYTFTGGEAQEGFGWASWRNRTDKILETLFPLNKS